MFMQAAGSDSRIGDIKISKIKMFSQFRQLAAGSVVLLGSITQCQ